MKRFSIISIILISIGVIACDNNGKCRCSKDNVCVTIINSTGQALEKVTLLTHGIKKDTVEKIRPDGNACLSSRSLGENSFILTASLGTGETIISREEYSEGGYKFIGIVTKERIEIKSDNTY